MIRFESVTKHYRYDAYPVLDALSFSLPEEPFSTLLMSSQSGKTTVAKLITGVEKPTSGKIFLRGRDISDIPVKARNAAYFPAAPLLFLNKTLAQNLAYPLLIRGVQKKEAGEKAAETLRAHGMEPSQKAKELSEYGKQKLAFLRASLRRVDLLLADDLPEEFYPLIPLASARAAVVLTSKPECSLGNILVIKDNKVCLMGNIQKAREYTSNKFWMRGDENENNGENQ